MTTRTWKDNVFFILDEPTEPGNIGASARALKNMGFSRLELVSPVDFLNEEARSMACQAKDLRKLYPRIQAALKLLEYTPQGDKNLESEIMRNLKRLIGRSGLTEWELNMLYGLCRQVGKKLEQRDASEKTR